MNKSNTIFLISAVFVAYSLPMSAAVSLGQTTAATTDNLVTYSNPAFGFSILYPSNWPKEISDDPVIGQDAMFLVPTSPIKYLEKVDVSVTNQTHNSLKAEVDYLINFNKHENPALGGSNYQVIESVPITVNGNIDAYKLVTTFYDKQKVKDVKSLQIFMLQGGKLYNIHYSAELGKYDSLLPTVQKMIDSFQFISTR